MYESYTINSFIAGCSRVQSIWVHVDFVIVIMQKLNRTMSAFDHSAYFWHIMLYMDTYTHTHTKTCTHTHTHNKHYTPCMHTHTHVHFVTITVSSLEVICRLSIFVSCIKLVGYHHSKLVFTFRVAGSCQDVCTTKAFQYIQVTFCSSVMFLKLYLIS